MGKISVTVRENNRLPKLCWLLQLFVGSGDVEISVGSRVELFGNAIVEGCWDGNFDVHELENKNLFGSAVKWAEDSLQVLGSISLTDRICYARDTDRIIVSNSLFAVMGLIGAELDEEVNYYKLSYAPLAGIDDYLTELPIKHESIKVVHQLYHRNVEISANGETEFWCKTEARNFSSYKMYEESMRKCVNEIFQNITSKKRTHSVLPYATLSSGYDSTAVAALAKDAGVTKALLCTKPKPKFFDLFGDRFSDDGSKAGYALNLKIEYVNARDYPIDEDEMLYVAPSASTPETSFFPMARYIENTQVLGAIFTGYHGDKIWDKNVASKYVNNQLIRGDMSGINISEARLKSGFFNVSVPFIFGRSAESIVSIGRSSEMDKWSVGGGYDRPIPRRIAEDMGVPRESFGIRKKAVIDRYPEPKNRFLAKTYSYYLRRKFSYSVFGYLYAKWRYIYISTIGRRFNVKPIKGRSNFDLSYWVWFWSASRCVEMYRSLITNEESYVMVENARSDLR